MMCTCVSKRRKYTVNNNVTTCGNCLDTLDERTIALCLYFYLSLRFHHERVLTFGSQWVQRVELVASHQEVEGGGAPEEKRCFLMSV